MTSTTLASQTRTLDWSPSFAYAVGLLTTDGCLGNNGKTITFTSKDIEQIGNFCRSLGIFPRIGFTRNARSETYRVQFTNKVLWDNLRQIGLHPAKSLTIADVCIPDDLFRDFLRGHLDGDGSITSYLDVYNTRLNPKYVYKRLIVRFISASRVHIEWLHKSILRTMHICGRIHVARNKSRNSCMFILKFGKKDSLKLLEKIYYSADLLCLQRKKQIYLNFI